MDEDEKSYRALIDELSQQIAKLSSDSRDLEHTFKVECSHPKDRVRKETNRYEDEYGKDMDSWTDYDYWCDRCGVRVRKAKKQFETLEDLQKALTEEVSRGK